jgi:hypothetical protein
VKADVTSFAPRGRPWVANEPVFLAILLTITNQHDGVVNIGVHLVATVENTAFISVPVVSIDWDCDWSEASDCVQQLKVVVGGKLNKARDLDLWDLTWRHCTGAFNTVVFSVGVLELLQQALALCDVVEGYFSCGTVTVALASALIRVGWASSDLLRSKVKEKATWNSGVWLNSSSGGKGPAWTTVSLIFYSRDDALLTPVNMFGEFFDRLHLIVSWEVALGIESFEFSLGAAIEGALLGSGEMAHVVDVFFPWGARVHVVGNNAFELSLENGNTVGELFSAVVDVEVVILYELLERVVLELAPVWLGLSCGSNEG